MRCLFIVHFQDCVLKKRFVFVVGLFNVLNFLILFHFFQFGFDLFRFIGKDFLNVFRII